tara:strand:- start:299 stop:463 length:165 start_codon:yes stop_codon:yes gene_type:complete
VAALMFLYGLGLKGYYTDVVLIIAMSVTLAVNFHACNFIELRELSLMQIIKLNA